MPQKNVRLTKPLLESVTHEAAKRGLRSGAALIRLAITNELAGRDSALTAAEERIAGGLDRIGRELRRMETAQQAEFALIDALARALFLCIPEPVAEVRSEALARAKQRHHKLLKMAALSMRGDVQAALSNLANHED